jgi:hypothetical protein
VPAIDRQPIFLPRPIEIIVAEDHSAMKIIALLQNSRNSISGETNESGISSAPATSRQKEQQANTSTSSITIPK